MGIKRKVWVRLGCAALLAAFGIGAQAQSLALPVLELQAEDQTPSGKFTTATEVKPILNATVANWVAVREWEGQDLIYVTHLWAWRCGLVQLEVGVNGGAYDIWPLPPCHVDTGAPNSILEEDGFPYRAFALNSVGAISVRVTYDDLSTQEAAFDRNGVLIP